MPEGPEVKHMAECMDGVIRGLHLLSISNGLYQGDPIKLLSCGSKGKKIIFNFEHDITLISSLGITGRWSVCRETTKDIVLSFGEVVSEGVTVEKKTLYYTDTSNFGSMMFAKIKDVGKDVLNDNITFEEWNKLLRNPRIQHKEIGQYLLDQKYVSGIGNYLRAEILFMCRMRPDRLLRDVSEQDNRNLYTNMTYIIKEVYKMGGVDSYLDPFGIPGKYKPGIYGQKEIGGAEIVCEKFKDGRTSWWCPTYQF